MREILLLGHKYRLIALVDDEDYERVSQLRWHAKTPQSGIVYAHNAVEGLSLYMHRYILGLKAGDRRIIDHINGDGLDNRRSNIRIATRRLNRLNSDFSRNAKLVDKLPSGRYRARFEFYGRVVHLGTFDTAEEATEIARRCRDEIQDRYSG